MYQCSPNRPAILAKQALPPTTPERDLAELRAALARTLRLVHRMPGPEGLSLLSVPSDREIIEEAERMRALVENVASGDSGGEQAGSGPSK